MHEMVSLTSLSSNAHCIVHARGGRRLRSPPPPEAASAATAAADDARDATDGDDASRGDEEASDGEADSAADEEEEEDTDTGAGEVALTGHSDAGGAPAARCGGLHELRRGGKGAPAPSLLTRALRGSSGCGADGGTATGHAANES